MIGVTLSVEDSDGYVGSCALSNVHENYICPHSTYSPFDFAQIRRQLFV